MATSVQLTAASPHPVESLRAAFADPAYWRRRLDLNRAGSPTMTSLHTDTDGVTTVEFTMRFGGEQLPGVLRALRLGALTVVHREQWRPTGDGLRGEVTLDAVRTPMSGHGTAELEPDGARTRLTGTAVVDVGVPLIGAPVARFLADQLAGQIRAIVRVTDRWLDDRA